MKKLTALVLALVLILAMTACVRVGPVEAQSGQAPSPSDGATEDQVYIEPDPTDRETAVRMLNHDPETDALWRALAQKHTDATGIRVIAMTAARGYYDRLLPEQLRGSSPVTLFFAAGPEGIPVKSADLSGTAAYAALTDPTLALTLDGQVVGLPFHTESYGLLVNIVLLEKAGFTAQDLLTLEGLEQVQGEGEAVGNAGDHVGTHAKAVTQGFDLVPEQIQHDEELGRRIAEVVSKFLLHVERVGHNDHGTGLHGTPEGHDGLGDVGHHDGHAVAGLQAAFAQGGGKGFGLVLELLVGIGEVLEDDGLAAAVLFGGFVQIGLHGAVFEISIERGVFGEVPLPAYDGISHVKYPGKSNG